MTLTDLSDFLLLPVAIVVLGVIAAFDFKHKKSIVFVLTLIAVILSFIKGCDDISDKNGKAAAILKSDSARSADNLKLQQADSTQNAITRKSIFDSLGIGNRNLIEIRKILDLLDNGVVKKPLLSTQTPLFGKILGNNDTQIQFNIKNYGNAIARNIHMMLFELVKNGGNYYITPNPEFNKSRDLDALYVNDTYTISSSNHRLQLLATDSLYDFIKITYKDENGIYQPSVRSIYFIPFPESLISELGETDFNTIKSLLIAKKLW